MRIAYTLVLAVVTVSALSSVAFAQVVIPCVAQSDEETLDHTRVVPVATVTRDREAVGLAKPQPGDGFVLGTATLDQKDPACTKIVFTLTNPTPTPISLATVSLHSFRVKGDDNGRLHWGCSYTIPGVGRPYLKSDFGTLQPGATVTVEMEIAPRCGTNAGETAAFMVTVGTAGLPPVPQPAFGKAIRAVVSPTQE